jgi:hypothetical protein
MVVDPLLHDKIPKWMTLITCKVIALIISIWHDDDNGIPTSVIYSANRSNNNMDLLRSFLFSSESLLPTIAVAFFLMFSVSILAKDRQQMKNSWLFPATLSLLFLLFSVKAIVSEGLLGFWTEHTRNLWGNQIWFDLLLGVGIGWYLIVPQAKALGMRLYLWLALIVCTGCIGFLAMIARLLYLQERSGEV